MNYLSNIVFTNSRPARKLWAMAPPRERKRRTDEEMTVIELPNVVPTRPAGPRDAIIAAPLYPEGREKVRPASDRDADLLAHACRPAQSNLHRASTCAIGRVVDSELEVLVPRHPHEKGRA